VKDQYFGDVNDYRKYGLLRCCSDAGLKTGVCWMLTPNDGRSDGRHIAYLAQERQFRHHDPRLFDCLRRAVQAGTRSIALVEQSGLLPTARFVSGILAGSRVERQSYFARAGSELAGSELVFFDPDNGLEVNSVAHGTTGSAKYLFWSELDAFWTRGHSVLVYQHFRREVRNGFTQRLANELRRRTAAPLVASISTSHVVFLLAGRVEHEQALRAALALVRTRWHGQMSVSGSDSRTRASTPAP
jgi:hypothetical protein